MAGRTSRSVVVAAWAIPIMVVGQFAMLAVVPVAVVVIRTFREAPLKALRPLSLALAAVYALPLALWAIGPDRARSLSRDMHPALATLIVAVAGVYLFLLHAIRRRAVVRPEATEH